MAGLQIGRLSEKDINTGLQERIPKVTPFLQDCIAVSRRGRSLLIVRLLYYVATLGHIFEIVACKVRAEKNSMS